MNRGLYGASTIVLSSIVALIGIVMIVVAIAGGGGPLARGVLIGVLFTIAGAGRVWMAWRVHGPGGAGGGPDGDGRGGGDDG